MTILDLVCQAHHFQIQIVNGLSPYPALKTSEQHEASKKQGIKLNDF